MLFRHTALAILVSVQLALAPAARSQDAEIDPWVRMSSGSHSVRDLGPGFSIEVPVVRDPTAKLAFFNYDIADRMGVPYPKDPKALKRMLEERFGWKVDPTGKSPVKWIATHYMDSGGKGPGHAQGDGRALWSGELVFQAADGRYHYVDVIQKGVGATPFAWIGNPGHEDGLQSVGELVKSAILTDANLRNGLDPTADLFGFTALHGDQVVSRSVRVGHQIRPAHHLWHADNPRDYRRILEYDVRRNLGLPLDAPVGQAEIRQFLLHFAENSAEETARGFDLHGIQQNPTAGNKTTRGGSIDLGGWLYLDAHHSEYRHLFDQLEFGKQIDYQLDYFPILLQAMDQAYVGKPISQRALERAFETRLEDTLERVWLARLGLTPEESARVKPRTAKKFREAVEELYRAEGNGKATMRGGKINGQGITPAAYDMRRAFAATLGARARPESERAEALRQAFVSDRSWFSAAPGDHAKARKAYLNAVEKIVRELSPAGKVEPRWGERARSVNAAHRFEPGFPDLWWERNEGPIIRKLETHDYDFLDINRMIRDAPRSTVDPGLPVRAVTNVGPHPSLAARWSIVPTPGRKRPVRVLGSCVGDSAAQLLSAPQAASPPGP
jgi:hypothetical protein